MVYIRGAIASSFLTCFLVLPLFLNSKSVAYVGSPPGDYTFDGIDGFEVRVSTELSQWSHLEKQILDRAREQLREENITVYSDSERPASPGSPYLLIGIKAICVTENDSEFIQMLQLDLKEPAILVRDSNIKTEATTWSFNLSAKFEKDNDDKTLELVGQLIEGFAGWYRFSVGN